LQKQGYTRVQHEVVTGPMLPFGTILKKPRVKLKPPPN
jgi:hypothetical protein